MIDGLKSSLHTCLMLDYILELAGAKFEKEEDAEWDIDLSLEALTKDSFNFLTA